MPSRRVPQLSFSSRVTYCRSSGDFIGQDQVECGLNGRGKTSLLTYLLTRSGRDALGANVWGWMTASHHPGGMNRRIPPRQLPGVAGRL